MFESSFFGGNKPGYGTGFDTEPAALLEMGRCHGVVVASAIFGKKIDSVDVLSGQRSICHVPLLTYCYAVDFLSGQLFICRVLFFL